jgi:hypothetical protein
VVQKEGKKKGEKKGRKEARGKERDPEGERAPADAEQRIPRRTLQEV